MKILCVIEHRQEKIKKISLELLGEASRLGESEAVILGSGLDPLVETLKDYPISKLYVADHPSLESYNVERYTSVLYDVVEKSNVDVVFFGDDAFGIDLASKLATRLKAGLASDCTELELSDDLIITRPIFAGKILTKCKIKTPLKVLTLRPKAFKEAQKSSFKTSVENLEVKEIDAKSEMVETLFEVGERMGLTEADIVVSGGRGFKTAENFEMCYELAALLGAAVGSSRAASDAGFIDAAYEVGQTGKVVAPTLYIAIGISGAIQHQVGMNRSKCIVAINKDPDAPIFGITDYGLVDDLFKVLPLLTEE
ncbi:MAG: electron transfer flavoprotein subunit alpha/FixB family protein, partial [Candidatus Methanofastidiosia archaeon]